MVYTCLYHPFMVLGKWFIGNEPSIDRVARQKLGGNFKDPGDVGSGGSGPGMSGCQLVGDLMKVNIMVI